MLITKSIRIAAAYLVLFAGSAQAQRSDYEPQTLMCDVQLLAQAKKGGGGGRNEASFCNGALQQCRTVAEGDRRQCEGPPGGGFHGNDCAGEYQEDMRRCQAAYDSCTRGKKAIQ